MKIKKDEFKQIVLTLIAVILIGIGYFNYTAEAPENLDTVEVSADYNEINLGDVEFVNSDIVPNDDLEQIDEESENPAEEDYFVETRIERDKMYSEMIEVYQNLIKSEDTPEEQKSIASQEITNITNIKQAIMVTENLIKNKGFEDVVVLVNSNNVNVIVKSHKLNQEEISQIQNIIQRELKVEISNISITNK